MCTMCRKTKIHVRVRAWEVHPEFIILSILCCSSPAPQAINAVSWYPCSILRGDSIAWPSGSHLIRKISWKKNRLPFWRHGEPQCSLLRHDSTLASLPKSCGISSSSLTAQLSSSTSWYWLFSAMVLRWYWTTRDSGSKIIACARAQVPLRLKRRLHVTTKYCSALVFDWSVSLDLPFMVDVKGQVTRWLDGAKSLDLYSNCGNNSKYQ